MRVRHPMFAAMLVAAGLLAPGHALAQNDPDSVKQMVSAAKKQSRWSTWSSSRPVSTRTTSA